MTRTKATPTKKYRLEVDPRILELLGPNLYTNIYYVLAELIANAVEDKEEMLEAVRHAIGADTLGYISLRSLVAASEQPASRLCTACFDGKYPIELPGETALGKNVVEHMLANAARGAELDHSATGDVPIGR